jgi:hypothetical protein
MLTSADVLKIIDEHMYEETKRNSKFIHVLNDSTEVVHKPSILIKVPDFHETNDLEKNTRERS